MSDLENANSVFDISVKLCCAVEKHKCLYDRHSVRKVSTPECEKAWLAVAKECNQTADFCRNRWKNLMKAFYQGIKRRGNPYYLHEYMSFVLDGEGKTKTKRQPEAVLNDETNSTTTHEESVVNVDDEAGEESDSNTNSADESNEQIRANNSQAGGIFIIDEIGEEADEGENRERRLSYKRSCKRGLDPELLGDEDSREPEGKRTRRVMTKEGGKRLDDNDLGLLPNKKVLVRVDKIKVSKSLKDNKGPTEVEEMWSKKIKEAVNSTENLYTETSPLKRVKMVDSSTFTEVATRCMGTQYESALDNTDYDEIFMQSIKERLQEMNPRQKMNFKAKMYQSLLDVFDDSADFPGSNEVLKLPPNKPRVVNTTTGELRLMRELVSLVQAAKITPEIVNAKEKVKTTTGPVPVSAAPPAPAANKTPIKLPVANNTDNRSKAPLNSPLSLSPTLDDDDFQFSLDNIDDEDDLDLPRTWEEIKAKSTPEPAKTTAATTVEENVMGLPRRILQKVVRVSGSAGSTIVARDGDKKRIYRIYPKSMNPNGSISPATANKNTNMGTFYVTPAKVPGETITSSNPTKHQSTMPNISIRSFNTNNKTSSATSNTDTMTTANNSNESSTATNPGNQTAFKNIHPANRILSSSTGYFKMLPSPKPVSNPNIQRTSNVQTTTNFPSSTVTKVTAVAKNHMLPPTLANLSTKRTIVRSHNHSPQLMQRRYSICGPLPAEKSQHTLPTKAGSSITSKGLNTHGNSLQTQPPTSESQIKISQPISLNSKATTPSTAANTNTPNIRPIMQTKTEKDYSAPVADIKISFKEPQPAAATSKDKNSKTTTLPTEEIPILETAGTVGVDVLDPLFVKATNIKSEPSDD